MINDFQLQYIEFCQTNSINWADATRRIPLPDNSVEVLYSSHMLEHLDRNEAIDFLKEVNRVLIPNGIIRLAVPDFEKKAKYYAINGDADAFIESTHICIPRPRTFAARLRILIVGTRHHQWMYDSKSLSKLLIHSGFYNTISLPPGETHINNPGSLDLSERVEESIYIEAIKK